MAATFEFREANGVGETITTARTECNWKNIDDSTTAYSSSPITAGNNSYEKWQFGYFSGTYNQILGGLWAHTAGTFGTGLTLKASKSMTVDADRLAYATPSTATNANLTYDATAITAIASGKAVWFGATSPTAAGLTAQINGGVNTALTYVSGNGTTSWKVRLAQLVQQNDTVVIDYDQATGEILAVDDNSEIDAVVDLAVTNNLTKRIREVIKNKTNAVLNAVTVKYGVFTYDSGAPANANWIQGR